MKPVSDKTINDWLKAPPNVSIEGRDLLRFLRQLKATRAAIRKHKQELPGTPNAPMLPIDGELYRSTLPEGEK